MPTGIIRRRPLQSLTNILGLVRGFQAFEKSLPATERR
jgi:hypothetical protein